MCQILERSSGERESNNCLEKKSAAPSLSFFFFLSRDQSSQHPLSRCLHFHSTRPLNKDGGEWKELLKSPHLPPGTAKEELYETKCTYSPSMSYFIFLFSEIHIHCSHDRSGKPVLFKKEFGFLFSLGQDLREDSSEVSSGKKK